MAMPEDSRCVSPGAMVNGADRHARRSRPAEPGVAYAGMQSRIRGSRIFRSIRGKGSSRRAIWFSACLDYSEFGILMARYRVGPQNLTTAKRQLRSAAGP